MTKLILAAGAALLALPSTASAGDDFQQWLTSNTSVKLDSHWRLSNELVLRFSDQRHGLYEVENSTLVGYQLNKKIGFWAGYVHDPNYAGGDFTVMEHRAREQVTFDNVASLGSASLSFRARTEQRWRDGVGGTGWRFRPYAKLALPLGGKTAPSLVFTTEPFINLNRTSFQTINGFDRVRNAVALSVPLSKTIKADIGYLNQYRVVKNGPDQMDHALTGTIGLSF
ncbi:DUF2490 domain-containing protein [Sphingomonas sp. ASV193]|uniref:DUF2490 domain-containing protein n=1 Tax=Sphingomonas sp. ASV193 TaxID=3144405 RepID=UPI0032E8C777